jgi:hypothetical protein
MAVAVIVDIPGGNQQIFEAFAHEQLIPAVQKAENVTPQLSCFPVYRLIRTSPAPRTTAQSVFAAGPRA